MAHDDSNKPARRPLGYRVGERLRVAGDAVSNPQQAPGKAYGWFRRWLQKIWKVRGGGLYATGYIVCFIYFELSTIAGEIEGSAGPGEFLTGQIVEFLMRFTVDSIVNMVRSFIWPVYVVGIAPPYGAIALGLGFVLFSRFLQKPIERWLFEE